MMVNCAIRFGKDFISNYNASIKRGGAKTRKASSIVRGGSKIRFLLKGFEKKSDGKGGPYDEKVV